MAKETIVLSVEGDALRGVRLAASGDGFARAAQETWPLGAAAAQNAGEAADGGEDASPDAAPPPLVTALLAAKKAFGAAEFAFAFPLARFLVKTVRLGEETRSAWEESAAAALAEDSPFPDEELVVGAEIVSEGERDFGVVAGALPAEALADVSEALAAAKVRVARVDVLELGWLRAAWPQIASTGAKKRRLVLTDLGGAWALVVMDDGALALLRALGHADSAAELVRETTLSLLACDDRAVDETVLLVRDAPAADFLVALGALGPVRVEKAADPFGGVEGVAQRLVEGATFDATPADWTAVRVEAGFRRKLFTGLGVAVGIWALAMGVLFGVPVVYGQLAAREKTRQKQHQKQYKEVADMRARVRLVQRYSDHARGALEMLKQVSDRLPPEGVTLTSFQYKRGEGVKIFGEADQPSLVYDFKNALVDAKLVDVETEEESKLFAAVDFHGPTARGSKQRFDVDAAFEQEEDESSGGRTERSGGAASFQAGKGKK